MPRAPNHKFCNPCAPIAFAELARARAKEYNQKNKERIRQYNEQYREKHKHDEAYHSKRRLRSKFYNAEVRRIVLSYYGGGRLACMCCGKEEADFLTLDHVKNDGAQERRALAHKNAGGVGFYKRLINRGFSARIPDTLLRL